jgi:hypothetical protein
MPVSKTILVLANSYKRGSGRCLAGREILETAIGIRLGGWIRPVTYHSEGELLPTERQYPDGSEVSVGEIASVRLREKLLFPAQPENWGWEPDTNWNRSPLRLPQRLRVAAEEFPDSLWIQPNHPTDRVSRQYLQQHPPAQSLYLVRPKHVSLRFETTHHFGVEKNRKRCLFQYRGQQYDLSLTDPVILQRYQDRIPRGGKPAVEFKLPVEDDLLFCVSLTREFEGNHYKIVATICEGFAVNDLLPEARLFTIGHSNHTMEKFLDLLKQHQITALADLRSTPFSAYNPQFNKEALMRSLKGHGIQYVYLGEELGARRTEPECYLGDRACYDLIAKSPLFLSGLDRIKRGIEKFRVAMMCAEKDPLTCHRSVLVCRHLRQQVEPILHIREDGSIEPQVDVENRLMQQFDLDGPNLFLTREELLEQAYHRQEEKIGYVAGNEEDAPE